MEPLYFVTSNKGKVEEAKAILGMPIYPLRANLGEIQSLGLQEIVRAKAKIAFELVGKPLFVDDVGLYIEAWNGFPGPFIKHLLQAVGKEGLLKMIRQETNRNVTAKAAVGFHNGTDVLTFEGEVRGSLATESRGGGGWGWDPLFIPIHSDKTYAEMGSEKKNAISHRKAALEEFKKYLGNTRV